MTVTTDNPVIEIAVPELRWPHIYMKTGPVAGSEKFNVSFDADSLPHEWWGRLHRRVYDRPFVCARSNTAPLVSERHGRYELMAMLFEQADVRNIPRDRLLRDIPAIVKLTRQHVKHYDLGEFDVLVLLGVTVDVDDMKRALEAVDV